LKSFSRAAEKPGYQADYAKAQIGVISRYYQKALPQGFEKR
jgi:hypothetical protein